MMYYCVGIKSIILLSVSQLGTLFASDASFWCYININELYIKKRLFCITLKTSLEHPQIMCSLLKMIFLQTAEISGLKIFHM